MVSFKQFLQPKPPILQSVDLFFGRFQPFHVGHAKVIETMTSPVIAIVRGAKTSLDVENNPLSFEDQQSLIETVFPTVPIIPVSSGYLPDIILTLREMGYDVKRTFAGADRSLAYQAQLNRHNKKASTDSNIPTLQLPEFVEPLRVTSATTVRQTIRLGKYEEFIKLMPPRLQEQAIFNWLQSKLLISK